MAKQSVDFDFLADWCSQNPELVPYIKIEWTQSRSETKRSKEQMRAELTSFLADLRKRKEGMLRELEKRSDFHGMSADPLYGSDRALNVECRKCNFVSIEIYNRCNYLLTQSIMSIAKKEEDTKKLLELFRSDVLRTVNMTLMMSFMQFEDGVEDREHEIMKKYVERMSKMIKKYPKPSWCVDFGEFFVSLIGDAKKIMDSELVFVPPFGDEDILARCMTCQDMPFFHDVVMLLKSDVNNLPNSIVKLSKKILKNVGPLQKSDLSLGYQLLYRCLFEIYFVNNKTIWPKTEEGLLNKIRMISSFPAEKFNLITEYMNKDTDVSLPINLYVQNDEYYSIASTNFSSVLNCSNPLDMLYNISKTIDHIKFRCSDLYCINTGKKSQQCLSFDTIFTLFFMIFLGSEIVDIFAVSDFIQKFAPCQLSANFKFSKMLMESLAIYCKEFDVESLLNST